MNLNTLQEFRHGMYTCFGNAKDALFNLVDALSSEAGASSFPELSCSPFFERTWEGLDAKGARIQVRCWNHLHLRAARSLEVSLIQIIRHGASGKARDPKSSWFVWKG